MNVGREREDLKKIKLLKDEPQIRKIPTAKMKQIAIKRANKLFLFGLTLTLTIVKVSLASDTNNNNFNNSNLNQAPKEPAPSEEAIKETELNAVGAVDASITFGDLFSNLSDSCYDEYGNARYCEPEFENVAYEKQLEVSSECGKPPSRFCTAHHFQSLNSTTNNNNQQGDLVKKSNCHICDSQNGEKKHPAAYLTDSNNLSTPTCWVSAPINLIQSTTTTPTPNSSTPTSPTNSSLPGGQVWDLIENRVADNVSLVLNLDKSYEITYISLQFCSLKPDSLAIYKSNDFGSTWSPYQFYSSQCQKMYNRETYAPSSPAALTTSGQEQQQQQQKGSLQMEATCLNSSASTGSSSNSAGRVAFLTHEGRGASSGAEKSQLLQDWITATNIKIVLDRHQASWIHSSLIGHRHQHHHSSAQQASSSGARQEALVSEIGASSMLKENQQQQQQQEQANQAENLNQTAAAPAAAPPIAAAPAPESAKEQQQQQQLSATENSLINPSDTFNYAISDLTIGGRCKCNGHADKCIHSKEGKLQCDCRHNTAGPDCERCAPFHHDRPWARASQLDANPCQPCNCNGHTRKCVFDPELYQLSGKRSGGVCIKCKDNTDGRHCHYCKEGYTRDHSKLMSDKEACKPCDCHPLGSMGSACNQTTGQCPCKEGVVGLQCNRCAPGYQQSSSPTEPCIRLPDNDINSLLATNSIEMNETNDNKRTPVQQAPPATASSSGDNGAGASSQEPSLASVVIDEEEAQQYSGLPGSLVPPTRAAPSGAPQTHQTSRGTSSQRNDILLDNINNKQNHLITDKFDPIADDLAQLSGGIATSINRRVNGNNNNNNNRMQHMNNNNWQSQKRKQPFANNYYQHAAATNNNKYYNHHHQQQQHHLNKNNRNNNKFNEVGPIEEGQIFNSNLDQADLIDPGQLDQLAGSDGYSSSSTGAAAAAAAGATSSGTGLDETSNLRRVYYPATTSTQNSPYPYKDFPSYQTINNEDYLGQPAWPITNQNAHNSERRRLLHLNPTIDSSNNNNNNNNNDFNINDELPDSNYQSQAVGPMRPASSYDDSSTFNQIHSQPPSLAFGVGAAGSGSARSGTGRGPKLYGQHLQFHRNRINQNGQRGQSLNNNRQQLLFTNQVNLNNENNNNNNEQQNEQQQMRIISCGDCQSTIRKLSTRQFCHLDFAIKGNVLNRYVSEDWTRFELEIQDIFKSPQALMTPTPAPQTTSTTMQQHSNINSIKQNHSGSRIVPPNPMTISMGYISDNSLQQAAELNNNNTSINKSQEFDNGNGATLHRLKLGTIHSLWIPTEDLDCKCPKLKISTTYLLMGTFDGKENSANTLQLDRHGVAIEWKSGLQEKLIKAQSRQARGKC